MNDIATYLLPFSEEIREILNRIRNIIKENAPEAEEQISYGMPGYKLYGKPLVYFGAFKNHIGFYGTPSGHDAFQQELSGYKQGKGSVQFPFARPMPYDLMERMVQFRISENKRKAKITKESE